VTAVALKGLLGRKFRSALTAIAIVLGVAMASGTLILTDTISKAFDQIFVTSRKGTSVVISREKIVERSFGRSGTVPATLLTNVRALKDVAAAAGATEDDAKLIGENGKVITSFGPPSLAEGVDLTNQRFNPYSLVRGRWPHGPGETAIDDATAKKQHFRLGSTVGVTVRGPVRRFRLTGTLRFAGLSSLGSATFALFDVATAQRLFHKEGQFDSISVAAARGTKPEALVREIAPLLPKGVQVKTAKGQAESDSKQVKIGLSFLTYALLAFAGIALFVGAFVIFNTISITVAQRTREFATLRTLGAQRRQVLTSVVLESFVIGAIASVTGLFVGLGLSRLLEKLFVAAGIDLPTAGTVLTTRTIVVGLLVGVVVAVVAGLLPAMRATRVPPIAAVREGATLPPSRLAPFALYIAGTLIAIALALLAYGMFAGGVATTKRLILLGAGSLLLFIGVAQLSTRIVKPLASMLGWPSARVGGIAGLLARQNSVRNPGRTAATAAALMIGLALVTFVAVLGQGLRSSVGDTIKRQVRADYVVSAQNGIDPFPAAAGDAVAQAPQVAVASSVRGDSAKVAGSDDTVTGLDPATIRRVYRFEWQRGSDAVLGQLGSSGAIVANTFADRKHLRLGSRFTVVTPSARKLRLVVKGIYKAPALGSLLGAASISRTTFDATFASPRDQNTYVLTRGGASPAAEAALSRTLAAYPDAKLQTKQDFVKTRESRISLVLSLLYVLLALSVIVSIFGMVNTLALSIVERTRELGMLRAIGMTQRQVRRMVRHESVITALIGAALGLPLGVFLAALVTAALSSEGIVFALPGASLVVFAIAAVVAGILAAIGPARRAARLDVLKALQYE
jgi:putative ABC transport system permease protein